MSSNQQVLRRLKQFSRTQEFCELCGNAVSADHDHLIEPATKKILCSCRGCRLLFPPRAGSRFVGVPSEVKSLPQLELTDHQWTSFLLPIELAFFFQSSAGKGLVAVYPSPAGPTETKLPPDSWESMVRLNPVLEDMQKDVEALLVNRTGQKREYFLAPIDECYRLVGVLRTQWKGLSGGTEVWKAVAEFFTRLKGRARPAEPRGIAL